MNDDCIRAIAKFVVERLVGSVYPSIRGTAKAMLTVSSIPAVIKYVHCVREEFANLQTTQSKKYERFKDAPIHLVYSDSQEHPAPTTLNDERCTASSCGETKRWATFSCAKLDILPQLCDDFERTLSVAA